MKSFFGQTSQQQDAESAFYWRNLEAVANKLQCLQKCWELYLNGEVESPLFIDSPRRTLDALDWAYKPVFDSGDYTWRQWLEEPGWKTGIFAEHSVLLFPLLQFDVSGNAIDVWGFTAYDLDGRQFGNGGDSIELDRRGNLIIEGELPPPARPMDIPLKDFLRGLDYMIAHGGRTKEEVEQTRHRVQERMQQFRNARKQQGQNK